MKIKVTIHLNGIEKIDKVIEKAEMIKEKNPYVEVHIEVLATD